MVGRYLHDIQVKDGFAYLAYFKDGLVILDVGNGMKGGTPENPQAGEPLHLQHHRFLSARHAGRDPHGVPLEELPDRRRRSLPAVLRRRYGATGSRRWAGSTSST